MDSSLDNNIADWMELNDRVSKVVPRLQDFATWHFYLKVLSEMLYSQCIAKVQAMYIWSKLYSTVEMEANFERFKLF